MKANVLKAKSSQYGHQFVTSSVQNCSWRWPDRRFASSLYADNRKRLREIFGKPSFCYRGEFYYHCWLLDLNGKAKMLVLTAKGKGTCYEVVTTENGVKIQADQSTLIDFMDHMEKTL